METQQGLSYARNRGIREAKNEILVFIDDDAIAEPGFLQNIHDHMITHEHVAGGGQVVAKFETAIPKWYNRYSASMFCSEHRRGNSNKIYKSGDYPFGCNMIFHKSIFDEVGLFDVALGRKGKNLLGGEEKDIFTKIQKLGHPIFYLADALVHHCIDDYRLADDYVDRLSLSLGKTHSYLYKSKGRFAFIKGGILIAAKFVFSIILAIGYAFMLRFSVAGHLIKWRFLSMKGYFFPSE